MRALLLLFSFVVFGCGKAPMPDVSAAAGPTVDRVAELRERDAQAAFGLDAASSSIADALEATRALASRAGGDAKEALLDVAAMLDSAGATLSEYGDPPPALATFRKDEAGMAAARKKALGAALDALKELRDAQGTLDDLSGNAPEAVRDDLAEVGDRTDEAIDSVESAIPNLGGAVPKEED